MKQRVGMTLIGVSLLLTLGGVVGGNELQESVWEEDFSTFEDSLYHVDGNAYWDSTQGYFVLTPCQNHQTGRLFLRSKQLMYEWYAEFDLLTGGGSGADGLTMAFCDRSDYPPDDGGALDFWGASGYAIEFDTYYNEVPGVVEDPTQEDHVAVIKDNPGNHLCFAEIPDIEDNQWHHVSIQLSGGVVKVWIDGFKYLDFAISGFAPFEGVLGFTAATGGKNNWHIVDNIAVCMHDQGAGISGVVYEDQNHSGEYENSVDLALQGAVVQTTFGYCDTTDLNGLYLISGIPPGEGYEVTASKAGYLNATIYEVSISGPGAVLGVDIALEPSGTTLYTVLSLAQDPNPPNSLVMHGGTLHRYYKVVDGVTMEPRAGIEVLVDEDPDLEFTSDQGGVVKVSIPSSKVGDGLPDATGVFTISHVNGQEIDIAERMVFQAGVVDRRYSRTWQNEFYQKLGISLLRLDHEFGSSIELTETSLFHGGADSLTMGRQRKVGVGVAWGVEAPAQVELGVIEATAGAEVGVSMTGIQGDEYRFVYDSGPISDTQAQVQYILFFDGNKFIVNAALVGILSFLEGGYEG